MKVIKGTDKNNIIKLDLSDEPKEILDLAQKLHNTFCYSNHTDQCSYDYEKWNELTLNSSKFESFLRALRVINLFDGDINKAIEGLATYKRINYNELSEIVKLLEDNSEHIEYLLQINLR